MKPTTAWPQHRIDELTRLVNAGLTGSEIAAVMKATLGQISGKLGRLGLKRVTPPYKDWTPARVSQLEALLAHGATSTQIGAALGIVRSSVLRKIDQLGLPRPKSPAPSFGQPRMSTPRTPSPKPRLSPDTARHWLTRSFGECAFIVSGDGYEAVSCCAPAQFSSSYCRAHHAVCHIPGRLAARDLARTAKRYG